MPLTSESRTRCFQLDWSSTRSRRAIRVASFEYHALQTIVTANNNNDDMTNAPRYVGAQIDGAGCAATSGKTSRDAQLTSAFRRNEEAIQ